MISRTMALRRMLGAVVIWCGCAEAPPPPPPPPICDCRSNYDCQSGAVCLIGLGARCGVCEQVFCSDEGACDEAEICDLDRGVCERSDACRALSPTEGCEAPALCAPSVSEERCVIPESSSCVIVPHTIYVREGAATPAVDVVGLGPRGRPQPFAAQIAEDDDAITATDGRVSCSAPIVRLSALQTTAVRVVARDADTGAAIPGAAVRIADITGETDGTGVFVAYAVASMPWVRVDVDGYETVAIISPPRDVEVLLTRAVPEGTIGGAELTVDATTTTLFGDIRYNVASLSFSNLVDDLTIQNLAGPTIDRLVSITNVTDPDGTTLVAPTSTNVFLGGVQLFARTLVVGRPGTRILSFIGGSTNLADADSAYRASFGGDDAPYDGILGLWVAGVGLNHVDVGGTTEVIAAAPPVNDDDLLRFAPDGAPLVAGHQIETTDEIDVIMPPLPPDTDTALVLLFVEFPGFGMNPIAFRVVTDVSAERVRLFVAPTLWTAGRPLVAVVMATTADRLRNGLVALDRVAVAVADAEVVPPQFAAGDAAIVDGMLVALPAREGGLVTIHGVDRGVPFRVHVAGGANTIDLAGLGFEGAIDRVWLIDVNARFDTGSFALTRELRRPSRVRALFSAQ